MLWNGNAGADGPSERKEEDWIWASKCDLRQLGGEAFLKTIEDLFPSAASRVQTLGKALQGWQVGVWEYAEHWPSAREQVEGTFKWSVEKSADNTVRRRRISRRRVNIRLMAECERLSKQHITELQNLREELNL
ncbi:unnamed protein product [Phytomonas sp. Hart1]|nr:unnamed protein product [Phytomonas sp. Hart1]|eukprot:CCW71622.1 unnamed protein product [Phytomonas sp. isolate Hart1]